MSYPRVLSPEGQPLVYAKSEGAATFGKMPTTATSGKVPDGKTPVPSSSTTKTHGMDYSSDESGTEDEHIVRIDSPSTLSFPQVQ